MELKMPTCRIESMDSEKTILVEGSCRSVGGKVSNVFREAVQDGEEGVNAMIEYTLPQESWPERNKEIYQGISSFFQQAQDLCASGQICEKTLELKDLVQRYRKDFPHFKDFFISLEKEIDQGNFSLETLLMKESEVKNSAMPKLVHRKEIYFPNFYKPYTMLLPESRLAGPETEEILSREFFLAENRRATESPGFGWESMVRA